MTAQSRTLTWHLGSDVISTPIHIDPTPGHRSLWELDPSTGDPYSRPSLHPNRRGRELSDVDADRAGLDAFYAASARRRPPGVDIESVVSALSRLGRSRRPDPLLLAIASVTAEICFRGQEVPQGLRRLFAKPERDARPAFKGAASVLSPGCSSLVGLSSQGAALDRAASVKGRTRATWSETACKPTRASAGSVPGLLKRERDIDASRALCRAALAPIDVAALDDWLVDESSLEERVIRYRARMAPDVRPTTSKATWDAYESLRKMRDGADTSSLKKSERKQIQKRIDKAQAAVERFEAEDTARYHRALRWATRDVSDSEIKERISRARAQLERSLRRAPARAEELVRETGDRSWMLGLIPPSAA